MSKEISKNGTVELKFNDDRTQALAIIHPASGGGSPVEFSEITARLKALGVTYGVRDHAIMEAIHYAEETGMPAANVVVAQGTLPQDGKDARVQYHLPLELLAKPLPKRTDGLPVPDWFALDPGKMVTAGQELASVIPPQPGLPGKTLTWPIQAVAPKAGKPAGLSAGQNVQALEGTRLCASQDGYACLQGEQLVVHALRVISTPSGGTSTFSGGAIFLSEVQLANIRAWGFIAARARVATSRLRADGDILLHRAEHCEIITTGNVYVTGCLKDCKVITRKRVILLPQAEITGGKICAMEGVEAGILGTPDFKATELHTGTDHFAGVRNLEIQEELAACDANIKRISQALKPFSTLAVHTTLSEEKRALLQRLQAQKHSQETQISALHNEKRTLTLASKEKVAGTVTVTGTVWPGVWIEIGTAATQIEMPMEAVRFREASGGKSIQTESLQQAA